MTQDEYNKAAALVVRLRKDLELHTDALKQSNAQCAEYLLHNEMLAADRATLHRELVDARAALASVTEQRDSLRSTLAEWERADTKPHARIDPPIRMGFISETGPVVFVRIGPKPAADDVADHVVPPVLPMCMTCHECGSELINCSQGTNHHDCPRPLCPRTCTGRHGGGFSPYSGPCKSATPVRHE